MDGLTLTMKIPKLLQPSYYLLKRVYRALKRPILLRNIPSLTSVDTQKPVYIFFSPAAGVTPHNAAHAIIARTMKDLGHQVLFVHCKGEYPHCLLMDMSGFDTGKSTTQRNEVCRRCDASWAHTMSSYRLPSIELSDLVCEKERAAIHRQVMKMPADAGKFQFDGFRFGAMCGSDLALSRKVLDQMNATGESRRVLEAYVEGALIAYRAAQNLIERYQVARLVYFNEYSMVFGAAMAALKAGVPITRLSHAVYRNIDVSKIMLAEEPVGIYTYHRLLDEWPKWRELALPPHLVESITEHSLLRLSGSGHTVFSPKHGESTDALYEELGLLPERKLLVAYPSSMDEYHSNMNLMEALGKVVFSQDQPFPDQITWLRSLVAYVEASDDLQLVIRIHPREGRNIHESLESDNLANLKVEFSQPYRHVRVVWPEEKISSYDLAEMADVALSGWSNISLELARLGIPTLIAFQRYVPFPLGDVVDWAPTADEYFEKLRVLAMSEGRMAQVRYAFRWTNIYSLSLSLDFDDVVPSPDFMSLPRYKRPRVAKQVEDILVRNASVTEMNRTALVAAQHSASESAETDALRCALRNLIWFLATGEKRKGDYTLSIATRPTDADLTISLEAEIPTLFFKTGHFSRRSQVIRRLAPIAANAPSIS
jgi:hypothetical protein